MQLFSETILHGASNEPEVYSEPSQTLKGSILVKIVNG